VIYLKRICYNTSTGRDNPMEMTIKEFAEKHGFRPQSISQYLYRHKDLHDNYTHKEGRSVILTEQAQIILLENFKRNTRSTDVITQSELEEIQRLKEENRKLIEALSASRAETIQAQKETNKLLQEKAEHNKEIASAASNYETIIEAQRKENAQKVKEYEEQIKTLRERLRASETQYEEEKNKRWWQKIFR
jgi:DNA repair exonuclease SbcCD ATPase subunit